MNPRPPFLFRPACLALIRPLFTALFLVGIWARPGVVLSQVECIDYHDYPRMIFEKTLPYNSNGMEYSDGHAILIYRDFGIHFIELKEHSQPRLVAEVPIPGMTMDLAVSKPGPGLPLHCYVIDNDSLLYVVDCNDYSSPVIRSSIVVGGSPKAIAASEQFVFLALYREGVIIVDVSDPAEPVIVGSFGAEISPSDIVVEGNLLFVDDDNKLLFLDYSDPCNPNLTATLELLRDCRGLAVEGSLIYALSYSVLTIIDFSNPLLPTIRNWIPLQSGAPPITVSESQVFFSTALLSLEVERNWIQIVDASDPDHPKNLNRIKTSDFSNSFVVSGNYLIAANIEGFYSHSNLEIFDLANRRRPPVIGSYNRVFGEPDALCCSWPYVYFSDRFKGICILNASDPTRPTVVKNFSAIGDPCDIAAVDNFLYCVGGYYPVKYGSAEIQAGHTFNAGLQILDVANPLAPVTCGQIRTGSYAYSLAVDSGIVYVGGAGHFVAVDVSDPWNPVELSDLYVSGDVRGIALSGSYAFLASEDKDFQVIDIHDPRSPQIVARMAMIGKGSGIAMRDGVAYVGMNGKGLAIIDVSDPTTPLLLGTQDTRGNAGEVAVLGDFAYIADWYGGVEIVDVSESRNPKSVGGAAGFGRIRNVEIMGNHLYVLCEDSLCILPVQCPVGEDSSESLPQGLDTVLSPNGGSDSPPGTLFSEPAPNPFNSRTTIQFSLADESRISLRVFDLAGRNIRCLLDSGIMTPGTHSIPWNGLDEHGRPSPSGVYFARLEAGDFTATKRMALVR